MTLGALNSTSSPGRQAPEQGGLERRQLLGGIGALLAHTAIPAAVVVTTVHIARPGGWILREGDRDVS